MHAETQMQQKMQELFSQAGKTLKFFKDSYGGPARWVILVDGKKFGEKRNEWEAFQQALDKSGIGGKISYTYSEKKSEWTFRYTPKKGA